MSLVIVPLAFLFGIIVASFKKERDKYFLDAAISIDQNGNTVCKYLFNILFIKRDGVPFGSVDETISSVTGRNHITNTLTNFGKIFRRSLDRSLGKDHCVNAIGE